MLGRSQELLCTLRARASHDRLSSPKGEGVFKKYLSMYKHRITILGAALALAAETSALPAPQLQTCGDDAIPLQTTNWSGLVTIPRFDSGLGILQSIDFSLAGDILGSAAIESLDAAASTVTTDYQAIITLTRPDNSVLVVSIPAQQFVDNLTSFDGTIDFGGTSGITHPNLSTTDTQGASSVSPADIALFSGPAGNPGSIQLPVDAAGSSGASGSGNLITQFLTDAGATVSVCYNYAPDCNGNGIPDDLDIQLGANDHDNDGIPDECQPGWRSFCEGDGALNGGVDCPCLNSGAPGEGCTNVTGTGGILSATGIPSISGDTLTLTASQIPNNAPGFFFFGNAPTNGGNGIPFYNGLRCIDSPIAIRKVDFGGTIPQGNMPTISVFVGALPGDTTYFQYWYRDPIGPCQSVANTTNGIEVTWGL